MYSELHIPYLMKVFLTLVTVAMAKKPEERRFSLCIRHQKCFVD